MDNTTQNEASACVASTPTVNPGIFYTSPDSVYPQKNAITIQQQPPVPGKCNVLLGKSSAMWLGVSLVLCSVSSQIGAAVAFRFYAGFSEIGVGVWCGYMFMAAGAVAIVTCHCGTKKLIIGTTVTSGLAVVAAIIQLSVATVGIENDVDDYGGYDGSWKNSAIAGNATMFVAATSALISAAWILVIGCVAIQRKQTSFKMHSTPVQHVQQQQQQQQQKQQQHLVPLNHPNTNTIHPPMSSQIVELPPPYIQTIAFSTMPSQQYVHQNPQQQLTSLNHPPPNAIDLATPSQLHGHHEAQKNYDAELLKF